MKKLYALLTTEIPVSIVPQLTLFSKTETHFSCFVSVIESVAIGCRFLFPNKEEYQLGPVQDTLRTKIDKVCNSFTLLNLFNVLQSDTYSRWNETNK